MLSVYAVKHKDEDIVAASRSGGIFTALSNAILQENGVIYGCILDKNFDAIHARAETQEERNKMRGSKYIQSKIGNCFNLAKNDLDNGRWVLFSGTPCQIAGLKTFLNKYYDNLLCLDIVCHAVPSPKVWHKYLNYMGNVKSVDFRNKTDFGWRRHIETITTDKGRFNNQIWVNIFYSLCAVRPICYRCPFKTKDVSNRPGDISIGDYWGIENVAPEFDDNKGVSLVIINSFKGTNIFNRIKNELIWKQTNIENSLQQPIIDPYPCPKERNLFWQDFNTKDFSFIAHKYGKQQNFAQKAYLKIKQTIKKYLNLLLSR